MMDAKSKRKYFSVNLILCIFITVLYALSLTFLFENQANFGISNTKYISDLPAHIKAGLSRACSHKGINYKSKVDEG